MSIYIYTYIFMHWAARNHQQGREQRPPEPCCVVAFVVHQPDAAVERQNLGLPKTLNRAKARCRGLGT